jgi:aspartate dehydrogenase
MKEIGIIGYGRIGSYLYSRIKETPGLRTAFIYEVIEEKTRGLDRSILIDDSKDLFKRKVDLIVEAADFRAVGAIAPQVLEETDMLILSASAWADEKLESRLKKICEERRHRFYIPHGALLGMDGFQDARDAFDEVSITTVKPPKNLDFAFQKKWRVEEINARTVLHDGSTREVCKLFPRNVNSHAVLAISSLSFDKTRSLLIANPNTNVATHHIRLKAEAPPQRSSKHRRLKASRASSP